MKTKFTFFILLFISPWSLLCQKERAPKNLKEAVLELRQTVSDSLKNLILSYDNENIKEISYPWGGDFKTVYNWTEKDNHSSRIKKYLEKRGVSFHQIEVILIAFKDFENYNKIDEEKILYPFQIIENKWKKEDEDRFLVDSLRDTYIPKNLEDCFTQIDKIWDDSIRNEIKNWSEDEFSNRTHFGFGKWLRNNWQLWGGSRLSKYFNDHGIFHPDDMSGIILKSYHRYLNKKQINFDDQIAYYKKYWEESERNRIQEEKEKLEESKLYFHEYKIGDTLEFNYNFDFSSKQQEDRWIDNSCVARGILLQKKTEGLKLKVKVIQTCDKNGIIYYSNDGIREYDKKNRRWTAPKKVIKKRIKKGKSRWFDLDDWELEY